MFNCTNKYNLPGKGHIFQCCRTSRVCPECVCVCEPSFNTSPFFKPAEQKLPQAPFATLAPLHLFSVNCCLLPGATTHSRTHTKEQFGVSVCLMCMILTGRATWRGWSHQGGPRMESNPQPSSCEAITSQPNRNCAFLNVQSETAAIVTQLSTGKFAECFLLGGPTRRTSNPTGLRCWRTGCARPCLKIQVTSRLFPVSDATRMMWSTNRPQQSTKAPQPTKQDDSQSSSGWTSAEGP